MQQRELLHTLKGIGDSLGLEEGKKLRSRFGYLQRIARDQKNWQMLGTITGLVYQCEAYERALRDQLIVTPMRRMTRPRKRHVAPGQLRLFGEVA